MDPQSQQMLSETLMLARENNQMLHKLVRAENWARLYRYAYWALIILSLFGSFFFIQPLLNLYTGGAASGTSIQNILKGLNPNQLQQDVNSLNQ